MHAHRPLPQDSDLARAVAVLARAQQDATWHRQQISNQLRSLLREYYPSALAAFEPWRNGLCRPEAHELLKAAPTPSRAARLSRPQLQAALKRAGRQRGMAAEADRLREVFRADWAHQPTLVEDALGKQMLALLVQLQAACIAADDLAKAVEEAFPQHPDAEIILSFPGLGIQIGARVLAETSPGAKAHFRRRRDDHGDWRASAQRHLFNRILGQLYHCLQYHKLFDEHTAFPTELAAAA